MNVELKDEGEDQTIVITMELEEGYDIQRDMQPTLTTSNAFDKLESGIVAALRESRRKAREVLSKGDD